MKSSGSVEELGFDALRLERIQSWMQSYVDDGKLPFAATVISRHGKIAWQGHTGHCDVETGLPYQPNTIVRIYSMTKPITAVGLMMLYEHGLFHLDDPLEDFLPEFADLHVLRDGTTTLDEVEPVATKPTIRHLFTHTAGLTYGFQDGVLARAYKETDVDFNPSSGGLAETTRRLSQLPLQFQPGEKWNYSVASDVLGRLIEVISGETLEHYYFNRIFDPLGMSDTSFSLPDDKLGRFASVYLPGEGGGLVLHESARDSAYQHGRVTTFSGGGGLLSTAGDYLKFAEMLRCGGKLGEHRLLSPHTVGFMVSNHLPSDLASMGPETWCETSFSGVGFGLGFSVLLDPVKAEMLGSPGDFGWGGMASTVFWVAPQEDIVVLYLTQFMPSSHYPLRKELRTLVYQALIS